MDKFKRFIFISVVIPYCVMVSNTVCVNADSQHFSFLKCNGMLGVNFAILFQIETSNELLCSRICSKYLTCSSFAFNQESNLCQLFESSFLCEDLSSGSLAVYVRVSLLKEFNMFLIENKCS